MNEKHIIWSNENLDLDDWRDDLLEQYPDADEYELYRLMDELHFESFMNSVHLRQLYDTGVDAKYGDKLITLSTCEYTYTNGRFVVVAKKI